MDISATVPPDDAILALLQPLSDAGPCGPALRHDPVFTEIRLAREEDDLHLPMRQWERPLKKADWEHIERLCAETLTNRTKDLQVGAWLLEAWTRQSGFSGLARGLQLVHELLVRFWEPLHPCIEDGDSDARVAPLAWINESLPLSLKVHVTLLMLVDRKPSRVSFADWERMAVRELAEQLETTGKPAAANTEPPLTRNEVIENVRRQGGDFVASQLTHVRQALTQLDALNRLLDGVLAAQAPNLGKLRTTLAAIERVLLPLLQPPLAAPESAALSRSDGSLDPSLPPHPQDTFMDLPTPGPHPLAHAPSDPARTGWHNRDDAYRTLEALAEYLGRIEPHSPTPYLIRRAVKWGRMPLPELMAEIIQEEGDLNRLVNLLALK